MCNFYQINNLKILSLKDLFLLKVIFF